MYPSDGPNETTTPASGPDQEPNVSGQSAGRGGRFTPKNMFLASLALCAGAFIAAVVFGVLWWTSANSDETRVAEAREDVLSVASDAIQAYTEFDYENPDAYRDGQLALSTKGMRDQINQAWKNVRQIIVENKQSAETTIFDIAVDELNEREGKAAVIASLEVEIKRGEESATKRVRIQTQMERVDGTWKLSGIGQFPLIPPGT
ncbi:MAG: hypothetical protein ACRDQW_16290 [Haloechinothrix sp.]